VKTKQNFNVGRSEGKRVRFRVTGGAGATEAAWYAAPAPTSTPDERFAALVAPEPGISMTDLGSDLVVDILLSPSQTEGFPVGTMYHELWATIDGFPERRAIGTMTVDDTLRN
jgi:hypothetical protein